MKQVKRLFAFVVFSAIFLFSCTKDSVNPNVGTTVIHDTIYIHDTITLTANQLTNTQLLIQKDWLLDEVERNIFGTNEQYIRGGVNTTGVSYDNVQVHFNADGSGIYTDETSYQHPMAWSFTTPDERNVQLLLAGGDVYTWNMVDIHNNYLHLTSPYGTNTLIAARYKQIP